MKAVLFILILFSPLGFTQQIQLSEDGYILRSLSQKGELQWQKEFEFPAFPPTMDKKALYLGNQQGELIKLNRHNGELIWRKKIANGWIYSPAISQQLLITGGQSGILYAFNKTTQKPVWQINLHQELVYQPVSKNQLTIATTFDGKVSAFASQNGELKWQRQFPTPSQFPLFYKKKLILASYGGILRFLSIQNGALMRQEAIQTSLLESPQIMDHQLILVNRNQQQYQFNL